MPKYDLKNVRVTRTQDEIVELVDKLIVEQDMFVDEYTDRLTDFLDYAHVKKYLKPEVTQEQWDSVRHQDLDAALRANFAHYSEWWKQKIDDERGISVHRGKAQFALCMFLAGMPEWEKVYYEDGGYYQRAAYEYVRKLCGLEKLNSPWDEG